MSAGLRGIPPDSSPPALGHHPDTATPRAPTGCLPDALRFSNAQNCGRRPPGDRSHPCRHEARRLGERHAWVRSATSACATKLQSGNGMTDGRHRDPERGPQPSPLPPLLDPRLGDVEDDASSTKQRSLLRIAGSLLAEISLPKLAVAWGLLVVLPGGTTTAEEPLKPCLHRRQRVSQKPRRS